MATSQELTADIQALATSFPKRLANDSDNSLLINVAPTGRQAKRHIQQINYSESLEMTLILMNSHLRHPVLEA